MMASILPLALWITALITPSHAHRRQDTEPNILCSGPDTHYCIGGSLQSSTIMSCTSGATAEIRSCNTELSNILPTGYDNTAVCYESSPDAGDAACAFNGTGYAFGGSRFAIPETILCDPYPLIFIDVGKHELEGIRKSKTTPLDPAPVNETLETGSHLFRPLPPSSPLTTTTTTVTINGPVQRPSNPPLGDDVCSNPWATGISTATAAPFTLKWVLVIPTPGVSASLMAPPSSGLLFSQSLVPSPTLSGGDTGKNSVSMRVQTSLHSMMGPGKGEYTSVSGGAPVETVSSRGSDVVAPRDCCVRYILMVWIWLWFLVFV